MHLVDLAIARRSRSGLQGLHVLDCTILVSNAYLASIVTIATEYMSIEIIK